MTRDQVLHEIRRTAAENGGVPLGKQRFFAETGIRESDWSGRWWTRWTDAVREAGFEPQRMNPRIDDDIVLNAAVEVVRELRRFPTAAELRLVLRQRPQAPSHNTFRRFGGLGGLRAKLAEHCRTKGFSDVLSIIDDDDLVDSARPDIDSSTPALIEGFVYLLKSGKYYKIGMASSVERRKRELGIQLPERAEVLHRIRTDDPLGVEAYWHRRFAAKRLNGEWFALTPADVQAFRRRRYM